MRLQIKKKMQSNLRRKQDRVSLCYALLWKYSVISRSLSRKVAQKTIKVYEIRHMKTYINLISVLYFNRFQVSQMIRSSLICVQYYNIWVCRLTMTPKTYVRRILTSPSTIDLLPKWRKERSFKTIGKNGTCFQKNNTLHSDFSS